MIGIVTAMEVEAKAFLRDGVEREEEICGRKFYKLKKRNAVLVVCGVGKVNAAYATSLLISNYNPDLIINCGVSGGLSAGKDDLPKVEILDVVVATACVQHDVDTSPLGDPKGFVSTVNLVEFPVDEDSCKEIQNIEGCKRGIVASGEQFVASGGKKRKIVKNFKAIACDMESGAVAQCAYIAGKKFVCVKCISDNGNGKASADYGMFCATAAEKLYQAVKPLLK